MEQQLGEHPEPCMICGSNDSIDDVSTGETVCPKCGYVHPETTFDRGPEHRAFTYLERQNKPRTGSPLTHTIHDQGFSTKISYKNRDHSGKKINPSKTAQFYRLRKWNKRSKTSNSRQRNLARALNSINRITDKLNLPRNVIETSAVTYRQALKKDGIRGRPIKDVAAASIYLSCRVCGVLKSLGDIADAANITRKIAACNYRVLYDLLDSEVPQVSTGKIVSRLVTQLGLSGSVERFSLGILEVVSEMRLTSGKSPSGVAAAVVYIGCIVLGERRIQKDIASRARVTGVTVRNRYKEIMEYVDVEVVV